MKFRKKPVVVEAVQYRPHENCAEIAAFLGQEHDSIGCRIANGSNSWVIQTLEGEMECLPLDWIIKGVSGEFYPCKPDIFAATYEPVEASPPLLAGEGVNKEPLPTHK